MNKLLIAALALGAVGFAQSAVSAPAASHAPGMIQTADGLVQKARDRDWGWKENRGLHRGWDNNRRGYWGRDRSWRDDKWRGGPKHDWDNNRRGRDRD
ncbi:hypothetical protein IYX23_05700 [Methylocystis sp. L43]|jgi:hypothetical protein|uniref:hypothetical protein n=1 Tax=unclassified Methylocystis TaxID=2625913 RepID=UPI0018C34CE7|nr:MULTISPECIES: hypothetical protein [unclassified Methylocystis]MBG0797181.1 hypothetical protein [Methylocystis sp. L43]MBG0804948.1 hypothetical protein [Methylocystis sp. H15]